MQAGVAIRQALRGDHKVIAAVLAAAFADDPILRWVLPSRAGQPDRLARYFDVRFTHSVLPYGQAQLGRVFKVRACWPVMIRSWLDGMC